MKVGLLNMRGSLHENKCVFADDRRLFEVGRNECDSFYLIGDQAMKNECSLVCASLDELSRPEHMFDKAGNKRRANSVKIANAQDGAVSGRNGKYLNVWLVRS
ncbi:MAG: hypothetical protein AABM30_03205 [Actinomycetota bacterium]